MGLADKVHKIEEELRTTQKHKGTEYHLGLLKAKLVKYKKEITSKEKSGGGGGGFDIKKSGDSTVIMIGLPSVGKSTLLNKLTNAKSEVAAYAFTTLTVIPGVVTHKGARIQLLDVPGILAGAASGLGRGKEVLGVSRNADLVIIMLDVFQPEAIDVLKRELEAVGLRLNKKPPNVVVTPKIRGGVVINQTVKRSKLQDRTIMDVLGIYGIHNADVVLREDVDVDQFIDVLAANRRYLPYVVVLNKVDLVNKDYLAQVKKKIGEPFLSISADSGMGVEELKEAIFQKLRFIRLYLKPRMGEADYKEPMIVRDGCTIGEVCDRIHRELRKGFRYAQVWGTSAKFPGQKLGLDHVLQDEDVITIISRNS